MKQNNLIVFKLRLKEIFDLSPWIQKWLKHNNL